MIKINIEINEIETLIEKFLRALKNNKKSDNTIKSYKGDLNIFNTYLKSAKITLRADLPKIDLDLLEGFIESQASNSASTINRRIISTRELFKYLKKHKIVTENVALDLTMLELPKRVKPSLNLEQSRELVRIMSIDDEGSVKSIRNMAMVSTLLNTGLRVAELCSIEWSNISFDSQMLTVIGKGNKERTIPLNDAIIKILVNYKQTVNIKKSCKVFPVVPQTVERLIKEYVKKAGLNDEITPHKFRRTFATLLYTLGDVDIYTLAELLGHESINTTRIYIGECEQKKREAVTSMPSFM